MRFTKMRTLDFALKISHLNLNSLIFCVQRKYEGRLKTASKMPPLFLTSTFCLLARLAFSFALLRCRKPQKVAYILRFSLRCKIAFSRFLKIEIFENLENK